MKLVISCILTNYLYLFSLLCFVVFFLKKYFHIFGHVKIMQNKISLEEVCNLKKTQNICTTWITVFACDLVHRYIVCCVHIYFRCWFLVTVPWWRAPVQQKCWMAELRMLFYCNSTKTLKVILLTYSLYTLLVLIVFSIK